MTMTHATVVLPYAGKNVTRVWCGSNKAVPGNPAEEGRIHLSQLIWLALVMKYLQGDNIKDL